MIRAIQAYHTWNKPFYGVNYGHVGFLLNECAPSNDFTAHKLPLLNIGYTSSNGIGHGYAVNDVWVERMTAQTARLKLSIDGTERLSSIYADGLLVCTPQGSTAYAKSMGGVPLPLDAKALQIVGSNVSFPSWRSALLGQDQRVTISQHSPAAATDDKRPIKLYADGSLLAEHILQVFIERDRERSVTLLFDPSRSLTEKITQVQFPK